MSREMFNFMRKLGVKEIHRHNVCLGPEKAFTERALGSRDLTAARDPQVVIPTPNDVASLLRVQAAASNLAGKSPHLLANGEVARALKQSCRREERSDKRELK